MNAAMLGLEVGEIIGIQRKGYHRGKGGVDLALHAADHLVGINVVGQVHGNAHMAAFAQQFLGGDGLAVQLIADLGGNGRGQAAFALIIHIMLAGVPAQGAAVQGVGGIAFQVGDASQAGAVGYILQAGVAVQPVAHQLLLNAAVRV